LAFMMNLLDCISPGRNSYQLPFGIVLLQKINHF
jgi:hypothetical protein